MAKVNFSLPKSTSRSQILYPGPLFLFHSFKKPNQTLLLKILFCLQVLGTSHYPSQIPCLPPFPAKPSKLQMPAQHSTQLGSCFFLPYSSLWSPDILFPPWTPCLPLGWSLDSGNLLVPLFSQIPNGNNCLVISHQRTTYKGKRAVKWDS